MHSYTLPICIIALGIVIAILHGFALMHHLYFSVWWFDIPMHFSGGVLVSIVGIWVLAQFFPATILGSSSYPLLLQVILFAVIVGTVWETFELIFKLTYTDPLIYIADTAKDMTLDIIGACAGYAFGLWQLGKEQAHV